MASLLHKLYNLQKRNFPMIYISLIHAPAITLVQTPADVINFTKKKIEECSKLKYYLRNFIVWTKLLTVTGGSSNLGSAVATSMNLTNSSEPMGAENGASYKSEPTDMMYYHTPTTDSINQTTDGFLSSLLNDEDLHLMDMAMNDGKCYRLCHCYISVYSSPNIKILSCFINVRNLKNTDI